MSDRLQKTKFLIKNDTEKDKKEQLNKSNETPEEDERDKYLNNQKAFRKKRDFFSFYSKNRRPTTSSEKPNLQLNKLNPEDKRFSAIDLMPRGFGIKKIRERIEFFEKSRLEQEYKINALNEVKKKFYDNEPRRFDMKSFKVQTSKEITFNNNIDEQNNTNKNNSNNMIKKTNLNLIVDYSKIINSSKINRKQKELDIFLKPKKDKKVYFNNNTNNINNNQNYNGKENQNEEISLSLNSFKEEEEINSTNFTGLINKEKNNNIKNVQEISTSIPKPKHRKHNSAICCYNDLIAKITEPEKKVTEFNNDMGITIKEGKNDKYIFVKKIDNKISVEKKNKFRRQSIKNVIYDSISDNMALDKFTKAKYNLNNANQNKILKKQIFEIFDKIIIDNNNILISKKQKNIKAKNQKYIKAIKIMPQLLLVKQKINSLLINNENSENNENDNDDNIDEKDIKTYISSIYFLNCIGLDPSILFRDKEKLENKNFINDIDENIKINGINDKKKYIKYYFRNLNKANLFLEILIDNINKIQIKENVFINK